MWIHTQVYKSPVIRGNMEGEPFPFLRSPSLPQILANSNMVP